MGLNIMLKEKDWYRKKVAEMLSQIDNALVLCFLYRFIKDYIDK